MGEHNDNTIGRNIYRFREREELSQRQLADKIGKTRSAVSQYESGKIVPRMGVIERLATALHVNKSDILGTTSEEGIGERSELYPLTPDEEALVEMYRKSSKDGKIAIETVAKAMAGM